MLLESRQFRTTSLLCNELQELSACSNIVVMAAATRVVGARKPELLVEHGG